MTQPGIELRSPGPLANTLTIMPMSGCNYIVSSILSNTNKFIGLMSRVFANGPRNWGSIPGQVIPKTQKMVLDAALLNAQHYKVWIKGRVDLSRERSSALPYTSV